MLTLAANISLFSVHAGANPNHYSLIESLFGASLSLKGNALSTILPYSHIHIYISVQCEVPNC